MAEENTNDPESGPNGESDRDKRHMRRIQIMREQLAKARTDLRVAEAKYSRQLEADLAVPMADQIEKTRVKIEQERIQRLMRFRRRVALFIGLPTLLAIIYYGLIATNYYEANAAFIVQSNESSFTPSITGLLDAGPAAGIVQESFAVREFIMSRDLMFKLEENHQFSDHYKGRVWSPSELINYVFTGVQLYDLYSRKVKVSLDPADGILRLSVLARTPEDAKRLAQAILGYSEEMVNGLSQRIIDGQLTFARTELEDAKNALQAARRRLVDVQLKRGELNPSEAATGVYSLIADLEKQLLDAKTQRSVLLSTTRADAPQVRALNTRISALTGSLKDAKARLIDDKEQKGTIGAAVTDVEYAKVDLDIAQQVWTAALQRLDTAASKANQQQRYLSTVVEPSLEDDATEPSFFMNVLLIFVLSVIGFSMITLFGAAVKEHSRI